MHIRRIAAVIPAVVLAFTATPAHAAEKPVYKGTGWKALTSEGIYSISPDPYVIRFASATARDRLTPALKKGAAQITAVTGVKVTVSSKLRKGPRPSCAEQPRHEIVFHMKYKPVGTWASVAYPCYAKANGSAWGGVVLMNSQYWTTAWFSNNPTTNRIMRDNGILHELGHIFGLDHVNYDRDRDGKVERNECVRNGAGRRPVMCAPSGGYLSKANGGRYTSEFDVPGLKQMRRNYDLR